MSKLVRMWFSEGAGGGAGAAPAAPGGAAPTGVKPEAAAPGPVYERANKRQQQPKTEFVISKSAAPEGQTSPADAKPTFEDLIKGDYKDDFGRTVQNIVQERLKNSKQAEATLVKLTPALEALFKKNGIEDRDIDALVNKITNDDSLYEDEALQKGIPVDTLKQMKALEAQANQLRQYQAQQAQQAQLQRHYQKMVEQGNALKATYPSFDLQAELNNPEFVRLTHPNVGIDVQTAYEVVHRSEIQPAIAATVAQKTSEKLSNSMATSARRPSENRLNPSSNAVVLTDDAKNWSPEHRREIYKRVKAGEKFVF